MEWAPIEPTQVLAGRVQDMIGTRIQEAMRIADKAERSMALGQIKEDVMHALAEEFPEEVQHIKELLYQTEKRAMRDADPE